MTSCYGNIGKTKKSVKEGKENGGESSSSFDAVSFNYEERKSRKEMIFQTSLGKFPVESSLKDGRLVELDIMKPDEYDFAMILLNSEIEKGNSWPFIDQMNKEEFLAYFVGYDAFTVRLKGKGDVSSSIENVNDEVANNVCGIFYIKPNFPGRCNHICNGG